MRARLDEPKSLILATITSKGLAKQAVPPDEWAVPAAWGEAGVAERRVCQYADGSWHGLRRTDGRWHSLEVAIEIVAESSAFARLVARDGLPIMHEDH